MAGCAGGHAQKRRLAFARNLTGRATLVRSTRACHSTARTLVVQANADGTPASIVVIRAPSDEVRVKAFQDARKDFGDPKPDPRTQVRNTKMG